MSTLALSTGIPAHIPFDNVPDYGHVPKKDRKLALEIHRMYEAELEAVPPATLHHSLWAKRDTMPRQMLCFMIALYCRKQRVKYDTLKYSIARAGGDLATRGLVTVRRRDGAEVFNLHTLSDAVLWRVYCEIPDEHRPRQRPQLVPSQREAAREKSSAKKRGGHRGRLQAAPQPEMAVEMLETWACCDVCEKWRRLFGVEEHEVPQKWLCSMHPAGMTCDTPQETMEEDEQWGGETQGAKYQEPGQVEQLREREELSGDSDSASESEYDAVEIDPAGSEDTQVPQSGPASPGDDEADQEDGEVDGLFGDDDVW